MCRERYGDDVDIRVVEADASAQANQICFSGSGARKRSGSAQDKLTRFN